MFLLFFFFSIIFRFEKQTQTRNLYFKKHYDLAWGFYGYRQAMYRNAKPHEGYQIVHSWLDRKPLKGFVYTSNVDGQFLASGIPSGNLKFHFGN